MFGTESPSVLNASWARALRLEIRGAESACPSTLERWGRRRYLNAWETH